MDKIRIITHRYAYMGLEYSTVVEVEGHYDDNFLFTHNGKKWILKDHQGDFEFMGEDGEIKMHSGVSISYRQSDDSVVSTFNPSLETRKNVEHNYQLEVGDVILVVKGGYGFVGEDEGKYVEVTGFGDYFDGRGVLVKPYQCLLETEFDAGGCEAVAYDSFGSNPMVLLNTKEELTKGDLQSPLETRKNDKNQMELVDTGFPNALMALGEVMTWAAKNKGYLANDWKDIPNPSMSLLGAASRHRNKRLKGEEFDDESGLPHLAHETFNVLAQLELLLIGKL